MLSTIKNLFLITKKKYNYVFFSENKFYQKYFLHFAIKLAEETEVIYLSCDKMDKIEHKNIVNICIGEKPLNLIFLNILRCKNFFITLTDLGNHSIKKNKKIDNYVYIFHSLISTHKSYTKKAFHNYDTVFSPGVNHTQELLVDENFNNLPKKKIINAGYFYLDYLRSLKNNMIKSKNILIAPSWSYSDKNFSNIYLKELIKYILDNRSEKIIFRPHPEQFKREKRLMLELKNLYINNERFEFDNRKENLTSMLEANLLITDNSGIAIEIILGLKKPVIYFDKYSKIHNKNFSKINNLTLEEEVKTNFGFSISEPNLNHLQSYIKEAELKLKINYNNIENFTKKKVFNIDQSVKFSYDFIINNSV